jgi:hypothetical protein
LGSLALCAASLSQFGILTLFLSAVAALTLSAVAVVLGIIGICTRSEERKGLALSLTGLVVAAPTLLLVGIWPSVLGLPPWREPAPADANSAEQILVPLNKADSSGRRLATATEWIDVSRYAIHQGDTRYRVTGVAVKPVEIQDVRGKRFTKENYLILSFRLTNENLGNRIDYEGGRALSQAAGDQTLGLRDFRQKTYSVRTFGAGIDVVGQLPKTTIAPWKAVVDRLIFEAPSLGIRFLRLEFPAPAFGGTGKLRLEIPETMIDFPASG